ncbi:MAG TPA: hypothetical protein VIO11_00905, partial [Candidatus Methanoperedens sp.]
SVDCVSCHGDKLSVAIPQCTKCHDGPIHQVHAGKVATQTCAYCHKDISGVHNALTSSAVCSHCHKDLIEVHGADTSCVKCHKTAPNIVKPLMSPDMVLICQDCHSGASVATIHGPAENKTACYECHKGTSNIQGSEVAHVIHASKVECKQCHEQDGKVVVPQCIRCHKIDDLHAFNKIGKLTSQSGLNCAVCHPGETRASGPTPAQTQQAGTTQVGETPFSQTPVETGTPKLPGFGILMAAGLLFAVYIVRKRGRIF